MAVGQNRLPFPLSRGDAPGYVEGGLWPKEDAVIYARMRFRDRTATFSPAVPTAPAVQHTTPRRLASTAVMRC